eukprot:TRINITY_DN10807_c0_g1_i1.p1 TRINITY_DN10807_c0_g1~~TRINITY_DN10807_c0_g1_i1.p1  ORF type:complete len:424 (-),score=57.19 TRINITY_DN10807_c0_g1_i1:19-1290(-)
MRKLLFVSRRRLTLLVFGLITWLTYSYFSLVAQELRSLEGQLEIGHRLNDLIYADTCHFRVEPVVFFLGESAPSSENVRARILFELSPVCSDVKCFIRSSNSEQELQPHKESDSDTEHNVFSFEVLVHQGHRYNFSIEAVNMDKQLQLQHIFDVPHKETPLKIAILSDSQAGTSVLREMLGKVQRDRVGWLIHVGDFVQNGYRPHEWRSQWLTPLQLTAEVSSSSVHHIPVSYCKGNHDNYKSIYTAGMSKGLYFAQSFGGARFIFLDANLDTPQQKTWLEEELASEESIRASFRIVFVHIPPFIEFWERRVWFNGEKHWGEHVRLKYVPIFEANKVDLVVGGHSHLYQRGEHNGTIYSIVGGAGGNLENERVEDWKVYSVTQLEHHRVKLLLDECSLLWEVLNLKDHQIDSFNLFSKTSKCR